MAADIEIIRITGITTGQVPTDITAINTRANAFDTHSTGDTTNPVQKPTSGLKYSYWVSTRLDADTTPAGTIDTLRWFADGANNFGSGITCIGVNATSYVQATGTPGDTGNELTTTAHSGLSGVPVDVFGHTSGAPKVLGGSINNPSTGEFGDYFIYQIVIDTDVAAGASTQEQFTFRYDET